MCVYVYIYLYIYIYIYSSIEYVGNWIAGARRNRSVSFYSTDVQVFDPYDNGVALFPQIKWRFNFWKILNTHGGWKKASMCLNIKGRFQWVSPGTMWICINISRLFQSVHASGDSMSTVRRVAFVQLHSLILQVFPSWKLSPSQMKMEHGSSSPSKLSHCEIFLALNETLRPTKKSTRTSFLIQRKRLGRNSLKQRYPFMQ